MDHNARKYGSATCPRCEQRLAVYSHDYGLRLSVWHAATGTVACRAEIDADGGYREPLTMDEQEMVADDRSPEEQAWIDAGCRADG